MAALFLLSIPSSSAQSDGDDFGGIDLDPAADESGLDVSQIKFLLGVIFTTALGAGLVMRAGGKNVSSQAVAFAILAASTLALFIGLLPPWFWVLLGLGCVATILSARGSSTA